MMCRGVIIGNIKTWLHFILQYMYLQYTYSVLNQEGTSGIR